MNRRYQKSLLTLASLLFAVGSFVSLSACSNTDNQATNNTPTEQSTASQTESPVKTTSDTGADSKEISPVTSLLPGNDRTDSDPLKLLQNSQIKKELNLTDEQSTKIKQIEEDFRASLRQRVSGVSLKGLDEKQQEQKITEISKDLDKQIQDTRTKVGAVLTPEQQTRWKQIALQIYGWGVLTKDDYSADLKLTPEQLQKMNQLRDEMVQKMRANWQNPDNSKQPRTQVIAQNRQRLEQIVKNTNEQALAVLTPEQKKNLETLKGKEFKLDPTSLPSPPS
ncbi:MAG: Spy/CpxP family protein refolding chaperone [Desmonostoc vinosum HA7617-LM4]|jgi:Spy/CpxP family protein refolding chaperone|nr:Spy/CpxP family protein refolding chaperone [Desmonostoc vinosum HA7617-LM4]